MSKLVEIACYHSLPEAAVAQSCLEAHGHAVVAMEYYHATMAWHHLGAIGGVRLAAPEAEVQQARTLLAAFTENNGERTIDEAEGERPSPGLLKRCISVILLFTLFGIVPPQVMKRRPAL